ncbi:hypothetical protein AB1Y20_014716 [Prymnesium parvum]|uniref:NADH-ubiquinone oxidoreductase 21kDa subunit N-terminal domain-containing protein n=1 Tax=Prymnesium parvum TaxID=97485 RepID=A0AB34IBP1_PRYPA
MTTRPEPLAIGIYGQPYPLLNEAPSLGSAFRNLRLSDYGAVAGWTALAFAVGFTGGRPLRRQNSIFLASFTVCAVSLMQLATSAERLRGLRENEVECKRYGVPFVAQD